MKIFDYIFNLVKKKIYEIYISRIRRYTGGSFLVIGMLTTVIPRGNRVLCVGQTRDAGAFSYKTRERC